MYNRYYPDSEGGWQKESRQDSPVQPAAVPEEPPMAVLPKQKKESPLPLIGSELDIGDLITLFVLLTIADDKPENRSDALMTLAFYFLL